MTDEDRDDPGPHTHCYVGTDQGDECEVCGKPSNQFTDLGDEWDIDWDGYQDADEPIGPQLPEYDFEGGQNTARSQGTLALGAG